MEISSGIEIIDLSLFHLESRTLIISDLQIGLEEQLNKRGVLLPRFQFKDMMNQLENIFEKVTPDTIVIAGDFKHEFGTISSEEWRNILKSIDYMQKHCKRLVLVKGNHDTQLGPILKKRGLEMVEQFITGSLLICHGHELPEMPEGIKTVVIGHEHPALGLTDDLRKEKFKCFLKGPWKNYDLIILPSFSPLTEGTDVLAGDFLSPFLDNGIKNFEAWVVADTVYYFGKLKKLMK